MYIIVIIQYIIIYIYSDNDDITGREYTGPKDSERCRTIGGSIHSLLKLFNLRSRKVPILPDDPRRVLNQRACTMTQEGT